MILVTGATGNVGHRVVDELARAGRPLRALVRDPAAASALEARGVNALVGDLTRASDRDAALVGVRRVIACHGAGRFASLAERRDVDGAATTALIEESAERGIQHFVLLSHLGADQTEGLWRQWLDPKHQAELALLQQQATMSHTILRLAPLMGELLHWPAVGNPGLNGNCLLLGEGSGRMSPLAPDDAALLAVRCIDDAEARNRIFDVGGPETFAVSELPRVFEMVYDHAVRTWYVPLWLVHALRTVVGLFSRDAAARLAWSEALHTGNFSADAAPLVGLLGRGFEDLPLFLRREAGAPPQAEESAPSPPSPEELPSRVVEPRSAPPAEPEPEPAAPSRATEAAVEIEAPPAEPDEPAPSRALEPAAAAAPAEAAPAEAAPAAEPNTQPLPEEAEEPPHYDQEPELDTAEEEAVPTLHYPPEAEAVLETPPVDEPPAEEPPAEETEFAPADTHGVEKRPPVRRPRHVEAPVVDGDE